jgi:uncharacterized protein YqeY
MTEPEGDPAETMQRRLQGDLRAAMKARAALEVSVLRGLIAAIDNAGAVAIAPDQAARYGGPGETSPHVVTGGGPAEVERRRLGAADVQALLGEELRVRQAAVQEFGRLARDVDAQRARDEAAVVKRYLS